MFKTFAFGGGEIGYTLTKSRRARRLRITVGYDSGVTVTIPFRAPEGAEERFVMQKINWILRSMEKIKERGGSSIKGTKREFVRNKEYAYILAHEKLEKFNKLYNFDYGKIYIRNQKTRWGSCSMNGNLSFNYKLVFLPEHLADYLVVHELCHIGELNHSKRFWNLVARAIPDYKKMQRELKKSKI